MSSLIGLLLSRFEREMFGGPHALPVREDCGEDPGTNDGVFYLPPRTKDTFPRLQECASMPSSPLSSTQLFAHRLERYLRALELIGGIYLVSWSALIQEWIPLLCGALLIAVYTTTERSLER